jgi:hypothetical protein
MSDTDKINKPTLDHDLDRIVNLRDAAHLSSLSEDTLRRCYPELVRKLSPRRSGMRLGDVLTIGEKRRSA